MANKKDMRREDLIVPYMEPEKEKEGQDLQGAMSSTLPMAAIFTRNKMIGWSAVLFAVQTWLSETPTQKASAQSPAYFSVGMALLSLTVVYMPLFLPPSANQALGNQGTAPSSPSPVPA